jgi:hypothetical protein
MSVQFPQLLLLFLLTRLSTRCSQAENLISK